MLTEKLNALQPVNGAETVTNLQKYRAVVSSGLPVEMQSDALSTLMDDGEYVRLQAGMEHGVTPAHYVTAKELLAEIDDNGTVTQVEAAQAIGRIAGMSKEARAALWQIQNKSWKAKNNPYDVSVGEAVYEMLHD